MRASLPILALLLSVPAMGQPLPAHRSNPYPPTAPMPTILSVGTPQSCPGTGCVNIDSTGSGAAFITITGTWSGTLAFMGSNDSWATTAALVAYPYSTSTGALSAGVNSTTANGNWLIPTVGFRQIGVYATSLTSNANMAVRINVDPTIVLLTLAANQSVNIAQVNGVTTATGQGASSTGTQRVTVADATAKAASTATAYTDPALPVAQRPTTVATAPVGGNLTGATATSVFSSTAGICQVAVSNLSTSIAMTCGQTNAVAAAVGLYVPPLGTYTTSWGYGGNVFCFPASGTPAYSTQATACP